MKAFIKYMAYGENHQKTIQVDKNEPYHIVRCFIRETGLPRSVYISIIKCGLTVYVWDRSAGDAFPKNPFCAKRE